MDAAHPQPVEPSGLVATPDSMVAVRMADEGIPVRAIARSLCTPSEDVYSTLRDAISMGTILEMPRDDWPPGSARSKRSVLHNTILDNEEHLKTYCMLFFKATPLEAAMLALMLRRDTTTKEQLHNVVEHARAQRSDRNKENTDPKIVDVMICKLRKKLRVHSITVETMWGTGYYIPAEEREIANGLLLKSAANG